MTNVLVSLVAKELREGCPISHWSEHVARNAYSIIKKYRKFVRYAYIEHL